LVKRFIGLMTTGVVLSLSLSVTSASGQTGTTTTLDPGTTTTLDPGTTTTLDPGTTTTLDPGTTTLPPAPTTTVPIVLQGEHVTSGTLSVGATFETQVDGTCALAGNLLGQEMNVIFDETGKIGAVYGKATLGGGDVGLVMVELGPLPMAIAAFRTTGGCNQDVVAIGPYTATATTAGLNSIGYAIFPNDYVPNVKIDLTVDSSVAPGSLDLQAAYDYLAAPRTPPTTVPPTTTTTTIP
jgi:hypothetical protein